MNREARAQANREAAEVLAREVTKATRDDDVTVGAMNEGCAGIDVAMPGSP